MLFVHIGHRSRHALGDPRVIPNRLSTSSIPTVVAWLCPQPILDVVRLAEPKMLIDCTQHPVVIVRVQPRFKLDEFVGNFVVGVTEQLFHAG